MFANRWAFVRRVLYECAVRLALLLGAVILALSLLYVLFLAASLVAVGGRP